MVGKTDWADLWLESPELVQVKEEIQALKSEGLAAPDDGDDSHGECELFGSALIFRHDHADRESLARRRHAFLRADQGRRRAHLHGLLAQSRLRLHSL